MRAGSATFVNARHPLPSRSPRAEALSAGTVPRSGKPRARGRRASGARRLSSASPGTRVTMTSFARWRASLQQALHPKLKRSIRTVAKRCRPLPSRYALFAHGLVKPRDAASTQSGQPILAAARSKPEDKKMHTRKRYGCALTSAPHLNQENAGCMSLSAIVISLICA